MKPTGRNPKVPTGALELAIDRPEGETSSGDRLSFSLFLAAALHVALILGIGFALPEIREPSRSMEVTLAQFQSRDAPEDADFLAQADQQGSGSLEEARERTTDQSPADGEQGAEATEQVPPADGVEAAPAAELARSPAVSPEASTDVLEAAEAAPDLREMMLRRAESFASADARQSTELQLDAHGPRVRRLSSATTRTAVEAAYVNAWRTKVEGIGNRNYPQEARRRGLEGDLRMLVEIDSSGMLRDVRILDSSGSGLLDEAAMRIVRLGAPYLPFPEEMRREADVLQIVRTWQFRRGMLDGG